jgi:hypothetical protein
VTKNLKLDIEISDFFELSYFRSEKIERDVFQSNIKFCNVLMSVELEEEAARILNNGGKFLLEIYYLFFFLKESLSFQVRSL